MNDYTSVPEGFKVCHNYERCLHPNGPVLPITEFYGHKSAKNGIEGVCKICKLDYARIWRENKRAKGRIWDKTIPTIESEADVIRELRSHGIFAAPGKLGEHFHLDIVAWGCVRIDAKRSQFNGRSFTFPLGRKDEEYWYLTDLIILVCIWPDEHSTYHVFPADHSIFTINGKHKSGVCYTPSNLRRQKHPYRVSITDELMEAHRDRWDLVEEYRQKVITLLENTPRGEILEVTKTAHHD